MKALFLTLLAATNIGADAYAAEPPISVSVAVPPNKGERRIEHREKSAHFHVIISNTSDKQLQIWRESCSWGYSGLTFEFTDERGKKWTAKKKPRVWTRNVPDWWTLQPQQSLVLDVHFGDPDTWEGFPHPEHGSQTVMMQAVFEFRPTDESRQHRVWTGRAASNADKFVFSHWRSEAK